MSIKPTYEKLEDDYQEALAFIAKLETVTEAARILLNKCNKDSKEFTVALQALKQTLEEWYIYSGIRNWNTPEITEAWKKMQEAVLNDIINEAIAQEREACAQLAEEANRTLYTSTPDRKVAATAIARAIRARSESDEDKS